MKINKIDESFICNNCKKRVEKLNYTSRDHCNFCLYSLHVDILPGDRKNLCKGLLKPIGLEIKNSKEKIIYKCEKCNQIHKNVAAIDDNRVEIINLSKNVLKYK